jgi:primosomal replication protein N
MSQINQVVVTGEITKLYPLINTPNNVIVSRFVLKHVSEQAENSQKRKVLCRLFCVVIGDKLGDDWLDAMVEIHGFLNTNAQQQVVVHVNKIRKLD